MFLRHAIIIALAYLILMPSRPAAAGPRGHGASLGQARVTENPRLVTSRGVGPVELGVAVPDVVGRLPVDWDLRWEIHDLGHEGFIHNRLYFLVTRGGEDLLQVDINSAARVQKITVLSDWFRTPDGLGVGVAYDRLARARGKLVCQGTGDFARVDYLRHASATSGNIEFKVCVDVPGQTGCAGPLGAAIIPCHEWLGATWLRPARGLFEESPIVESTLSLGPMVVRDGGDSGRAAVSANARSFLSRRCAGLGLCKNSGGCTVHVWSDGCPGCLPGSDSDCSRSEACRELGACSRGDYRDGVYEFCRPASDSHCRSSARCKSHGECALDEEGSCAPGANGHCQSSDLCRESGRCARDSRGRCAPASSLHCRSSRLCRDEGKCALSAGGYSWSRKVCAVTASAPEVVEAEAPLTLPDGVPDEPVEEEATQEEATQEEAPEEVEVQPPPPEPRVKKRAKKRRAKRRPRSKKKKKRR